MSNLGVRAPIRISSLLLKMSRKNKTSQSISHTNCPSVGKPTMVSGSLRNDSGPPKTNNHGGNKDRDSTPITNKQNPEVSCMANLGGREETKGLSVTATNLTLPSNRN